jgi:DGQHR domain-containing protein
MQDLTGEALAAAGQKLFDDMGLICIEPNRQVRLQELEPKVPHHPGEHLELDYLIPYGDYCLIGEITGGIRRGDVESHYRKLAQRCELIQRLIRNRHLWTKLGVTESQLCDFNDIKYIRGFFMASGIQEWDANIPFIDGIISLFMAECILLEGYVESIGKFCQPHFLSKFNIPPVDAEEYLKIEKAKLLQSKNRKIGSGDIGTANTYTFQIDPYRLLPFARVYRRDMLPSLGPVIGDNYQRPLIPKKLRDIRSRLLGDINFEFPSSILAVLSSGSRYDDQHGELLLPKQYGSLSIIDGQHRLFAYADEEVQSTMGESGKIMVTAVEFPDANEEMIIKYSARTFIEINTTQTPVASTHLDAIAYEILGETHARAIAAQVIIRANKTRNRSLSGLFDTSLTGLGIIQTNTVLSALQSMVNKDSIDKLVCAKSKQQKSMEKGYKNLFLIDSITDLETAEVLIAKSTECLLTYFDKVKRIFPGDWPKRKPAQNVSSLQYAKVIASFVRLFKDFLNEGGDWDMLESRLVGMKENIIKMRKKGRARVDTSWPPQVVFDLTDPNIPNASHPLSKDYKFLVKNCKSPMSILDIMNAGE